MSYAVTGYKLKNGESEKEVARRLTGEVEESEDYDGDPLTAEEKESVERVLIEKGLEKINGAQYPTFKAGALQIMIFDTQVSISAPYWESAKDDMQSGLGIAIELMRVAPIRFWDSQKGKFLDANDLSGREFDHGVNTVRRIRKFESRPWWKFW